MGEQRGSSSGGRGKGRGGRDGGDGGERGGKSKAAGGGGGGKWKGTGKSYTSTKREVGGPGVYVTCVRGKEGRCVGELYDLLDEIADDLYPPQRLAAIELTRPVAGSIDDGTPTEEIGDEDEDEDEDESIEDSIARELAEIKAGYAHQGKPVKNGAGEGKDGAKKKKHRFLSVDTATDCLIFIAMAWPYDPVEITQAIVTRIQQTGIVRTRYVQRIEPVTVTCHASTLLAVARLSAKVTETAFVKWCEANNKTSVTYQIEPSIRCHVAPLSRESLIATIGEAVRSLSSPPSSTSTLPDRPTIIVSADLASPDLVVIPTAWRNVYGISVVEGRLWSGKMGRKFNLEAIAIEYRKVRAEAEAGQGKVDAAGGDEVVEKPET